MCDKSVTVGNSVAFSKSKTLLLSESNVMVDILSVEDVAAGDSVPCGVPGGEL